MHSSRGVYTVVVVIVMVQYIVPVYRGVTLLYTMYSNTTVSSSDTVTRYMLRSVSSARIVCA